MDEDEDKVPESGPFCRHFHDPADCEEVCICGHTCNYHGANPDSGCLVGDCSCAQWEET
jgi:hypothetical protein